jgi:HEAT repeat protein
LDDSETVEQLCTTDSSAVTLTVIVQKPSGFLHRRATIQALQEFEQLGERGDSLATVAAADCIENSDWQVRVAALNVLAKNANIGEEDTVCAVVECLRDDDVEVRRAAVSALEVLVDKGDERAVAKILPILEHPSQHVRQSAIWALSIVAEQGDTAVAAALGLPVSKLPEPSEPLQAERRIDPLLDSGVTFEEMLREHAAMGISHGTPLSEISYWEALPISVAL